jgi:pimeloyl-ACP methyl ester carboxylesterase
MIFLAAAAVLAVLALITQASVLVLERTYPATGNLIEVAGGRMHVVQIGQGAGPPVVLVHGASSNLGSLRRPLGELLAKDHRVILIDRPGHGWSTRDDLQNSSPAMQAGMIDEALGKLCIDSAIVVVHSLAGALGPLLALNHPRRVAGLVMLAPVTHPWPGGVGSYNKIMTLPVIGPLLAYTITLPIGLALTETGARTVFQPQTMPEGYVADTATPLLLRPREFLANAWDLVTLKAAVAAQTARYGEIKVPTVLIAGDADKTVSVDIHARRFAAAVPHARLIVLPGVGHIVQNAAPERVVDEIDALIAALAPKAAAVR